MKSKKAEISEALESPGFWILGVGGVIAITVGWIASRKMDAEILPFWMYLVLIVGVLLAAAFFGTRE